MLEKISRDIDEMNGDSEDDLPEGPALPLEYGGFGMMKRRRLSAYGSAATPPKGADLLKYSSGSELRESPKASINSSQPAGEPTVDETQQNGRSSKSDASADIDSATASSNSMGASAEDIIDGRCDCSPAGCYDVLLGSEFADLHLREKLWVLFDEPSANRLAYGISVFIMSLIVLSVVTFILESLPQFYLNGGHPVFSAIELVCIVVFTIEFLVRFSTSPNLGKFVREPLNIVDLVAIVPFYVEQMAGSSTVGSSSVLRVVRLVRVFRVFKLTRYLSWVRTFTSAMAKSAQPLGMLLFVMLIGVIVFSSAIYYAERGTPDPVTGRLVRADGKPSPYSSIVQSSWWAIITMTTVGYGDDYPVTTAGKLIAAFTSLTGVLVLAIPITVISTNFSEEYNKLRKQKQRVKARITMLRNQFKQ